MRPLSLLLLALVGCAHVAPVESAAPAWKLLNATGGTDQIQLRTDARLRWATVTDVSVRGPDLDLKRAPGKLQGTTYIEYPVTLEQRGNEMLGRVGSDDFDLKLQPDGEETRATGLVSGLPCTIWLSPGRIRGSVGTCSFQLGWAAGTYSGSRQCGTRSENIDLQFPAALASWSDPEVASLLAILVQR